MSPRRTTLAALALALALVGSLGAACTGDAADEPTGSATAGPTASGSASEDPTTPPNPALPTTVDDRGTITEPLMEPVWLVRSTGTDESGTYEVDEQGLLVHGQTAIYHALDTILGVSLTDGSTLWKSPVDMGGEVVEMAGTGVHHDNLWSFVYPESHTDDFDDRGDHVVSLDVDHGIVVGDVTLDSYGTATAMGFQSGEQLLATDGGLTILDERGEPEQVLAMRKLGIPGAEIRYISPIAGTDVVSLEVSRRTGDLAAIAGYDVARRRLLWTTPVDRFTRDRFEQGYVYLNRADGRYVTQRDWDRTSTEFVHLWTLDPQTGAIRSAVVHRPSGHGNRYHQMRITESDIGPETPHGMLAVGDDIVFVDFQGISRFSPLEDRWVWTLRRGQMKNRHGDNDYSSFGLGPVSADGSLVYAFLSAGYSGDLVAVDLETGELRGRWAMDDAQEAGLVSEPLMEVVGDQVVLARNRAQDPELLQEKEKPLGPLNDLGLVRFPAVD